MTQPHRDRICPTSRGDMPFLREMLYEAAHWRPDGPRPSLESGLARADLAKLLAGWGRYGDASLIARDQSGRPVGAAWYRLWTDEDHSYGFVDEATPELGIAVRHSHRRLGVGLRLLDALLERARRAGFAQLSLSVERGNPARHLYERTGFRTTARGPEAVTMIAKLATSLPARAARDCDMEALLAVNRRAFGGDAEARLVEALVGAGLDEVSLVAELDGEVVGHILFSRIAIESDIGPVSAVALAPMAVLPEQQSRGIGSRLVNVGLRRCRDLGHRIALVLGHQGYYPRFGFEHALTAGLRTPYAGPSYMALEIEAGAMEDVRGEVRYPPAFDAV